ncbi:hypothetical protein ACJJIK_08225 [Microbulbifer sp. ZKSA006]|uniref:hypothetical protein n=1 Tax=Microbulbifer sp. ZKSA006 TaxID=3243390 RepID=UPI0040392E71
MNYADIPQKSSIQIGQNKWLRNVDYLWYALGVFQIRYAIYSEACIYGKLFVIQDKNHDKIMNELDPENELEQEIGKFKWLVKQEIISKE